MIARKVGYTLYMHFIRLALVGALLLPSLASAAGFAKQSIFLSKSPVTEGESVLIHTVVQNDGTAAFDGSLVVFAQTGSADKQKVGTVAVSIAPQGANTVSVSWKPAAGSYDVTAELTQKDGTVVESESARFTINERPKPASEGVATSSGEVQSSAPVEDMVAKYVPALTGVSGPIFTNIDTWRGKAASLLDQGINWSKSKVGAKSAGEVLGASTQNTSPQGLLGTGTYLAGLAGLYFFSVLRWLIANTGVFYPVVAVAFLYAIWRVFASMRRPKY